jgi:hypothetical protein
MSSKPLLKENSGLSNPSSSEISYNTVSHARLQSDLSLLSSSLQTVLLPPSAPKISPPSNHTTIGPYPIRSAPTYAQPSVSQSVPQSRQPQSATLTEKTPAATFNQETHPTAEPRSIKAIDSLFNSSTASNPSKEKKRASIFGKLKTKFLNKQVFSQDNKLVASPSGDKTVVRL